jgi:CRP-like cAMP-binding protein
MATILAGPTITLPPQSTVETVQELMAKRRDAAKHHVHHHLTQSDCVLICTHGIDRNYQHGEIIAEEGQRIRAVCRIKSGRICLQKGGQRLYNLTQGFFIGEGLFIHPEGEYDDYFGATLVANGPVTLTEINIPFVRQLLEVDKVLCFKIYRHIAGKLSAMLLSILGAVEVEEYIPSPETTQLFPSPIVRSDSQTSLPNTGKLEREGSAGSLVPNMVIATEEMVKEASHRVVRTKLHRLTAKLKEKAPFKVYSLDSGHIPVICQLTAQKIIIVIGAGIKTKRKIKYNKILDISKTGPKHATIIYGVQARTLFFRNELDLNEFCGIVSSLISTENKEIFTNQIAPNLTLTLTQPPPCEAITPVPVAPPATSDKEAIHQLATRQDLKKGDIIVAEGDLYQRIYTVVSGEIHMKKRGRHIVTLRDGEVFGVLTLFHLRPSMLDIEVASETATLLIIPGYKIAELITTNFPLAVRMHKKAAQLIYNQVCHVLKTHDEVVEKFSGTNFIG